MAEEMFRIIMSGGGRKRGTLITTDELNQMLQPSKELPPHIQKEVKKVVTDHFDSMKPTAPKVFENKVQPKPKRKKTVSKFAFETPLRICVVGESGSGKTVWVCKYLEENPFDQIIWLCPEHSIGQESVKELKKAYTRDKDDGTNDCFLHVIDCTHGINYEELDNLIDKGKEEGWSTAVVIDGLINFSDDPKLGDLFTAGRHANVSVFELLQQIFPPGSRKHRVNCSQFVVFKFAAKNEFGNLAQQLTINTDNKRRLVEKYQDIIQSNEHGCIIIDLKSKSTPEWPCRVRDTEIDCFCPELWNVHVHVC